MNDIANDHVGPPDKKLADFRANVVAFGELHKRVHFILLALSGDRAAQRDHCGRLFRHFDTKGVIEHGLGCRKRTIYLEERRKLDRRPLADRAAHDS